LPKVKLIHDDWGSRKNFQSVHRKGYALPWRCLFHPICAGGLAFDQAIDDSSFDNAGVSRMFDRDLKTISDHDAVIDVKTMIEELKKAELIDRYAYGGFVPVPERVAIFDLRNERLNTNPDAERIP